MVVLVQYQTEQLRRPRWVHMLVSYQVVLQGPIGWQQLQDFSLPGPRFIQDKLAQQVIMPGTSSLVLSNPVVGLSSVLPGSSVPGYTSPPLASIRFQRLFPPPLCCGARCASCGSQASRCDSLWAIYWISLALETPRRTRDSSYYARFDQLVIQSTRRHKAITDTLFWMQPFAVYTLMVTAYYPARVTDLLKYQLLIMRTA